MHFNIALNLCSLEHAYLCLGEEMANVSVEIRQKSKLDLVKEKKVETFFKVLKFVSNPEDETCLNDLLILFLKEISMSFDSCFQNIQDIKCVNVKMTKLESSFKTLHEKPSLTKRVVC